MARKSWLDSAKGIGIILAVFSHCYGLMGNGYYLIAGYMPMFFVLSGYLMKSDIPVSLEIRKRAESLLYPYVVYSTALILASMVYQLLRGSFSMMEVGKGFLGMLFSRFCLFPLGRERNIFFLSSGNAPMWFLTALFLASVLTRFYLRADQNRKKYIIIGYCFATYFLAELPFLLPWSLDTAFIASIFMLLGFWLKRNGFETIEKRKLCFSMAILFPVYMFATRYNGEINMSVRVYGSGGGQISIILFLVIGISYSFLCCSLCRIGESFLIFKLLSVVGKSSLSILCTHLLIYQLYTCVFPDSLFGNRKMASLVGCIWTIFAGVALHTILKRLAHFIPFLKRL